MTSIDVQKVNLKTDWICVNDKGQITTRKKDNMFVRFFKNLCCCKAYKDIRLNHVIPAILKRPHNEASKLLTMLKAVPAKNNKKYKRYLRCLSKAGGPSSVITNP